jgi:hypothetical protein
MGLSRFKKLFGLGSNLFVAGREHFGALRSDNHDVGGAGRDTLTDRQLCLSACKKFRMSSLEHPTKGVPVVLAVLFDFL